MDNARNPSPRSSIGASSNAFPDPFDAVVGEFLARLRAGERPTAEEFAQARPEFASQIRELFPALLEMEAVRPAAAAPASPPLAHQRLGDFRILRLIGRGGMGDVYEAVQESLERRVALKVLPPQAARDSAYVARFRREAHAAAQLHHGNIVPVYGVGEDAGTHYIAMQYIAGCSLEGAIDAIARMRSQASTVVDLRAAASTNAAPETPSHKLPMQSTELAVASAPHREPASRLPSAAGADACDKKPGGVAAPSYFRSIAEVGLQLAQALAHAHERGIVHRDIKPANLLLDASGRPWIADFGLAKIDDAVDLTHTGQVVGTLRYMAPERFSGSAGAGADVYALGLTLYELATLRPAFGQSDRAHLVKAILQESPPPRELESDLPRDLETIVLKAIEKEPASRFASASAMAEELRRFLADEPLRIRRVGPVERFSRWRRRNPLAAHLAIALAGILILSAAAGAFAAWRQSHLRGEAEASYASAKQAIDGYVAAAERSELLREPRFQPLMNELLASASQYYRDLAAQAAGRPDRLAELAFAQHRLGTIALFCGSVEEAGSSLRAAAESYEKLASQEAASVPVRRESAACRYYLAHSLRLVGKVDEAEKEYERAAAKYDALLAGGGGNAFDRHNAAGCRENLGKLAIMRGDQREATRSFEATLAIRRELQAAAPDDPLAIGKLAYSHLLVGKAREEEGERRQSIANYRRAVELYSRTLEGRKDDLVGRKDLARAEFMMGEALLAAGDREAAQTAIDSSLLVRRLAAQQAPNESESRFELAESLWLHGKSIAGADAAKASEEFEEAIAILAELVRDNPAIERYSSQLAKTEIRLGATKAAQGALGTAIDRVQSGVKRLRSLVEARPGDVLHERTLADGLNELGQLWHGRTAEESLASFEEAVLLYRRLYRRHAGAREAADLSANLANVAFFLDECGKEGAEALYQEALDLREQLAEREPKVLAHRRGIADIHNNLGLRRHRRGDLSKAAEAFRLALEIGRELTARDPPNADFRNSLAGTLVNLAQLSIDQQDKESAARSLVEAETHHQRALAADPLHPNYRRFYCNNRRKLLAVLVDLGRPELAAPVAEELAEFAQSPDDLVFAAKGAAQCAELSSPTGKDQSPADRYRQLAMKFLEQAERQGYADAAKLRDDEMLAGLRGLPRFESLIERLSLPSAAGEAAP